jgi:hypothetical protein
VAGLAVQKVCSLTPSLRQISPIRVLASAWRSVIVICSSVNLFVFIGWSSDAPSGAVDGRS